MDIATVAQTLGSAKQAYEIAKAISNSKDIIKDVNTSLQFADLLNFLAETKNEMSDLQIENRNLKEALNKKQNMKFHPPFYFEINGDTKEGPFCQCCWDSKDKQVRLIERLSMGGSLVMDCRVCNQSYDLEPVTNSSRNLPRRTNSQYDMFD